MRHGITTSPIRISQSIVLSASLFGALYIFSTSLFGINQKWIEQKKVEVTAFEIINGTILFLTGGIVFITSIKSLSMLLDTYN